jgi:hypothetical protein
VVVRTGDATLVVPRDMDGEVKRVVEELRRRAEAAQRGGARR